MIERLWWAPGIQPGSTHHNRKRENDCLDFSYNNTDFSFEKHLRIENSQNEHSAISLFYLGIIYVDKVPEIDPHAQR